VIRHGFSPGSIERINLRPGEEWVAEQPIVLEAGLEVQLEAYEMVGERVAYVGEVAVTLNLMVSGMDGHSRMAAPVGRYQTDAKGKLLLSLKPGAYSFQMAKVGFVDQGGDFAVGPRNPPVCVRMWRP
jgi:hypothetical protein